MNAPELLVDRVGAIVTLTLNRPQRLNALSESLARALTAALVAAADDPEVRVIVLRGAGAAFSAGGDVKQMAEDAAAGQPAAFFAAPLTAIHAAALAIRRAPKPVVAVLHGAVAGAALNLALCCDYRLAADSARLVQAFTNIGLVPDTGGTYWLPRLIGLGPATALLFEGRAVGAGEAAALGLVQRVVPSAGLEEAVAALAAELAARPTRALALTKRLLDQSAANSFAEQLAAEQAAQLEIGEDSPDFREGVRAFIEKRAARFVGR